MREIKFRFTPPVKPFTGFVYASLEELQEDRDEYYSGEFRGQYTGLKDQNGTEIYEGDILKVKNYYQNLYIVKYSSPNFNLFDGKNGVLDPSCFRWNDFERSEIVGNIYENGDLLK